MEDFFIHLNLPDTTPEALAPLCPELTTLRASERYLTAYGDALRPATCEAAARKLTRQLHTPVLLTQTCGGDSAWLTLYLPDGRWAALELDTVVGRKTSRAELFDTLPGMAPGDGLWLRRIWREADAVTALALTQALLAAPMLWSADAPVEPAVRQTERITRFLAERAARLSAQTIPESTGGMVCIQTLPDMTLLRQSISPFFCRAIYEGEAPWQKLKKLTLYAPARDGTYAPAAELPKRFHLHFAAGRLICSARERTLYDSAGSFHEPLRLRERAVPLRDGSLLILVGDPKTRRILFYNADGTIRWNRQLNRTVRYLAEGDGELLFSLHHIHTERFSMETGDLLGASLLLDESAHPDPIWCGGYWWTVTDGDGVPRLTRFNRELAPDGELPLPHGSWRLTPSPDGCLLYLMTRELPACVVDTDELSCRVGREDTAGRRLLGIDNRGRVWLWHSPADLEVWDALLSAPRRLYRPAGEPVLWVGDGSPDPGAVFWEPERKLVSVYRFPDPE